MIHGCSDHACLIEPPKQGTNGGKCRCGQGMLRLYIDRLRDALKKLDNQDHDDECGSDQGSRDGDCMEDHRCYCAARIARKALDISSGKQE